MAGGIQHTSSRGRGRMRRRAMAEINVTPFVDVMLVLLIVFMVTAPLLTVGVPVDLPKTKAPALGQDREPLSITVKRDGIIFLQKEQVTEDSAGGQAQAISANGYDQRIFVRGDTSVDYGKVMEVMGVLAAAGFTHIGLVTDVAKPKPDAQLRCRCAGAAPHHGARPALRRGGIGRVSWPDPGRGAVHLPQQLQDAGGQPCRAGGPGDHRRQDQCRRPGAAHAARREKMDMPPAAGGPAAGAAHGRRPSPRRCRPSPSSRSPRTSPTDRTTSPRPRRKQSQDFASPAQQADHARQAGEECQGGPARHPGSRRRQRR